jgi:hypothetical protein
MNLLTHKSLAQLACTGAECDVPLRSWAWTLAITNKAFCLQTCHFSLTISYSRRAWFCPLLRARLVFLAFVRKGVEGFQAGLHCVCIYCYFHWLCVLTTILFLCIPEYQLSLLMLSRTSCSQTTCICDVRWSITGW